MEIFSSVIPYIVVSVAGLLGIGGWLSYEYYKHIRDDDIDEFDKTSEL